MRLYTGSLKACAAFYVMHYEKYRDHGLAITTNPRAKSYSVESDISLSMHKFPWLDDVRQLVFCGTPNHLKQFCRYEQGDLFPEGDEHAATTTV